MDIFEKFFKENSRAIFRYFYYRGIERTVAEDLSSETFFRMYKSYKNDLNSKILWGIAKNVYKEFVRNSISNQETGFFDESFFDSEPEIDEISEYYDEKFEEKIEILKLQLHKMIEKLNPGVREVMKMRFIEGLKISEIAIKLGMPESTVKKYQHRGIEYLLKDPELSTL
jgi:RNA polymerase sigma-70 factor (ECF subfamily)